MDEFWARQGYAWTEWLPQRITHRRLGGTEVYDGWVRNVTRYGEPIQLWETRRTDPTVR